MSLALTHSWVGNGFLLKDVGDNREVQDAWACIKDLWEAPKFKKNF